jgi:hypothetical protein
VPLAIDLLGVDSDAIHKKLDKLTLHFPRQTRVNLFDGAITTSVERRRVGIAEGPC